MALTETESRTGSGRQTSPYTGQGSSLRSSPTVDTSRASALVFIWLACGAPSRIPKDILGTHRASVILITLLTLLTLFIVLYITAFCVGAART